jgi:hypothetical protein
MCYPYNPYDIAARRFIDVIELPLVVMDKTLFDYMALAYDQAFNIFKLLIDNVERYNGICTILWHPHYFASEIGAFYTDALEYLYRKNAWMTSAKEILDWWNSNAYMKTTQDIISGLEAS